MVDPYLDLHGVACLGVRLGVRLDVRLGLRGLGLHQRTQYLTTVLRQKFRSAGKIQIPSSYYSWIILALHNQFTSNFFITSCMLGSSGDCVLRSLGGSV